MPECLPANMLFGLSTEFLLHWIRDEIVEAEIDGLVVTFVRGMFGSDVKVLMQFCLVERLGWISVAR